MSKISVTTIAGLTSGGDANTVKIESGDALNVVSGDLIVDTSVLKVDASNNRVGVGTASPTSDLHVSGGAGAHVAIQSSAGSHWRLGDAVGSSNGIFVVRDHTNSANRIQILADGKTQIAQGITFGSDTADANALDDYEEGTFTPSAPDFSGSITFSNAVYVKIGKMVFVTLHITGKSNTSDSSQIAISGFPFSALGEHTASVGTNSSSSTPLGHGMINTAEIMYLYTQTGGGYTYDNLAHTSGYIRIQGAYRTA